MANRRYPDAPIRGGILSADPSQSPRAALTAARDAQAPDTEEDLHVRRLITLVLACSALRPPRRHRPPR